MRNLPVVLAALAMAVSISPVAASPSTITVSVGALGFSFGDDPFGVYSQCSDSGNLGFAACWGDNYRSSVEVAGDFFRGEGRAVAEAYRRFEPPNNYTMGYARAWGWLMMDQTYILRGGTGSAVLKFNPDAFFLSSGFGGDRFCRLEIVLAGSTDCYSFIGMDIPVEFGVPMRFVMSLYIDAEAGADDYKWAAFQYDLTDFVLTRNGNVIPGGRLLVVPEPGSGVCLLLGLAGFGALRRFSLA
ncbi:MAG: PEP-CTERM sorting domain-containing protein [Bryobacterales bacterium]|nr:PEP-CTERM sorting domain-containing protein [Bryobacterales bacterium]